MKRRHHGSQGLLECLTCFRRFSLPEIEAGRYDFASLTCWECLVDLQASPNSCFGKASEVYPKRRLGFNPRAVECRSYCPDRQACRKTVLGEEEPSHEARE